MLDRIRQSLSDLLSQWQFYLLLLLLVPLMFSLHWIAVRFPICFPDYIPLRIYEVERDKLAVIFEQYGPKHSWEGFAVTESRAWLLDIKAETIKLIACPPEIGPTWTTLHGQDDEGNLVFENRDANGNLIYEARTGLAKCVSWNARTGKVVSFDRSRIAALNTRNDAGFVFPIDWKIGTRPTQPTATPSVTVDFRENEILNWSGLPRMMQIESMVSRKTLHSWKAPDQYIAFNYNSGEEIHFSVDGKNVVFFTQDLRAIFVDKVTGEVLQHIRPRYWLPLLAVLLGFATLALLICWIRVSIRSGLSFWVDELVILAGVTSFLFWRISLSGNLYDKQRLAWFGVAAMAIAFLTIVVNQTLVRKTRLLYRCAPVIVLALVAIHTQWQWMWMERHCGSNILMMERARPDHILLCIVVVAPLIVGSIFTGLLLSSKSEDAEVATNTARRGFSLIEMFAWTLIVALMLSPLKLYYMHDWMRLPSWNQIVQMLCTGGVIAAVSLPAYFMTARPCHLVFRILGGALLAVLAAFSAAYRLDWIDLNFSLIGSIHFGTVAVQCERLLRIALGSILLALPIAMRRELRSGGKGADVLDAGRQFGRFGREIRLRISR